MKIKKKWFWPAVLVLAACLVLPASPNVLAQGKDPVLVGRIAHTEGQILRYVPDSKDWVATVKDAPFGLDDALYSDAKARAEFIMPNGLWVRIGGSTQLQLIALKPDASEMDIASGVARFYNKSSDGLVKITTPFGYVLAEPGASLDLYVGDQSVEVIALAGGVDFVHQANSSKYDVVPGSGSIIADARQVGSGDGTIDAEWDDWNASRDSLWTKRVQVKGESVKYVPPEIQDDAYALEENGKWERVYYEGEYHEYWRPTTVDTTWRPYTVGRWTDWYGDQCWVPDEPFGYVTHHYGNWVVVDSRWYWAPPRPRVAVVAGPVAVAAWYPGRVAWIGGGDEIGWVPLAPSEPYYSHRYWGPEATVVAAAVALPVLAITALAYHDYPTVVHHRDFYAVNNYRSVTVNVNKTTIINNYHAAPVVNNTVFKNYDSAPNRHNFTTLGVTQKPHNEVVNRIHQNQQIATKTAPNVTAASFKQGLATAKPVEPAKLAPAAVAPPKVTSKIVPANQVNAPASQVKFQPAEIKKNTRPATASPVATTGGPGGPGPRGPSAGGPGVQPGARPGTPGGPGSQPGLTGPGVRPGAPGSQPLTPGQQPGTPGTQPGVTTPGAKPGTQPTVQPMTPGGPGSRPLPPTTPGSTAPGSQPGVTAPGSQPTGTGPVSPRGQHPGTPGSQPTVQPSTPGGPSSRPLPPTTPGTTPGSQPGVTAPGSRPGAPGSQPTVQPSTPGGPSSRPPAPGTSGNQPGTRPGLTGPGQSSPSTTGSQPGVSTTPSGSRPGLQPTGPGVTSPRPGQTPPSPSMGSQPGSSRPSLDPGQRPGSQPSSRPGDQPGFQPSSRPGSSGPSSGGMGNRPSFPSTTSPSMGTGRPSMDTPRVNQPPATQRPSVQQPPVQQRPQQQPPAMQQRPMQQPPAVQQRPVQQAPPAMQQRPQMQAPAVQQRPAQQQPAQQQNQQQNQQQKKKPGEL